MFDFEMFFGRFHPLIVHLPIGFLLLAVLFKLLDIRNHSKSYLPAFRVTLLLSGIVAVITCLTGLLLSWAGTYPEEELDQHKWPGIGLAVCTLLWYFIEFRWNARPVLRYAALGLTVLLLLITGHRGGVLTHGQSYLWEGLPVTWQQFLGHDPYESAKLEFEISNLDSALVYEDIVVPILDARCYACHSSRKQKGELRLDSPERIRLGGESGESLIHDQLEESKLHQVLTLPIDDDLHMPPKGKTQLTKFEIGLIESWIREGGQAGLMVAHYPDQQNIRAWYDDQISDEKLYSNPLVPDEPVEPADTEWITRLRDSGLLIQQIGTDNHYLEASFINVPHLSPALINDLARLADQVIWVNLSGHQLTPSHIDELLALSNVTDLNLAQTSLPADGLKKLTSLQNVQLLNLTGSTLGNATVDVLANWSSLRKVYTYQSDFSSGTIGDFMKTHPQILIDTGGYVLPQVARDTLVFRVQR